MVKCDDEYWGEAPGKCVAPKHPWTRGSRLKKLSDCVCYMHKTVNKRIKDFKCLDSFFRHSIDLHSFCFRAVAVLIQLLLANGKPPFLLNIKINT